MIEKFVIGEYIVNPKRIGKGAFSSVYSGKDKYDNKVAVKKIEMDSIKNPLRILPLVTLSISL